MSPLERIIRIVQRRQRFDRVVIATGRWMCASTCVAALILISDRLLSLEWPVWLLMSAALAGLPIGVLIAVFARKPDHQAAGLLDHRMNLFDRMRSALETDARRRAARTDHEIDHAFAAMLRRDADDLAQQVDPRRVVPIAWPASWTWAVTLLAVVLAGTWFLPSLAQSESNRNDAARLMSQRESARQRAQTAIDDLSNAISEHMASQSVDGRESVDEDDKLADVNRDLDRLRDQLATSEPDRPGESVDESENGASSDPESDTAGELFRIAKSLDESAARRERTMDELASQLNGFDLDDEPIGAESDVDQLLRKSLEALQRGEADEAGRHVEDLNQRLDSLSDQEREDFARRLNDLSERIAQSQREAEQSQAERLEERIREYENLGFTPEEAKQLARGETPPSDIRDERAPDSLDEIDRERQRQQLAEDQQKEQAARDAEQQVDAIREGLREWADSMKQNEPAHSEETQDQRESVAPGHQNEMLEPGDRGKVDENPTTDQPFDDNEPAQSEPSKSDPGQRPEQERKSQESSDTENPTDGARQSNRTPDTDTTPGQESSSPPRGIDRIREVTKRIERMREQSGRDRQIGERMREEARRLMHPHEDQSSPSAPAPSSGESNSDAPPGSIAKPDRSSDTLGSNHRGFETGDDRPSISDSKSNDYHLYDFDNVDARSSHAGDENAELHPDDLVIEEWLDQYREDEAMADPDAPAQPMVDRKPAQAIQRVRDRTRTIERALNEQAIPSRYADLLRRWAGRLEGVLEKRLPTDQSNANRAPTSGETSDNDD